MVKVRYTEEVLREAVTAGLSFYLRQKITRYGIDTSHFLGTRWSKGLKRPECSNKRRTPEDIFTKVPVTRVSGALLRRALLEAGTPHICKVCGQPPTWRGASLSLEVDHEDGDWSNNAQRNLRFLCPNCHAQTDTFRGRNRIRRVVPVGSEALIKSPGQFNSDRADSKRPTKIEWPSKEALQELTRTLPLSQIAAHLGVSGVSVKKRCRRLGIDTRKRGEWRRNGHTVS